MKKSHNTILILIALLFSCNLETIIDLDIPPHQSLLVLNGRLDTDKEIKVLLSNSVGAFDNNRPCLLYTSPSPRDAHESRMPSSA